MAITINEPATASTIRSTVMGCFLATSAISLVSSLTALSGTLQRHDIRDRPALIVKGTEQQG